MYIILLQILDNLLVFRKALHRANLPHLISAIALTTLRTQLFKNRLLDDHGSKLIAGRMSSCGDTG